MSRHFDVDESCRMVRAQLAAMGIPKDASDASKMKLRHPEVLVAIARMAMTELNNGRPGWEVMTGMIEIFVDQVISLSGGPAAITPEMIEAVVKATEARLVGAAFEKRGRVVHFDMKDEPGGHA